MKSHPLTASNPLAALYRYVILNGTFIVKKVVIKKWINGLQLELEKGDAGLVSNVYYGLYEYKESLLLLHFLRKEDTFLDVGANLGHYSLLVTGSLGANSISVEPIPATCKKFNDLIILNKLESSINLHPYGVSNKEGNLYFSSTNTVMNHVVQSNHPDAIQVKVSTIDTLVDDRDIACFKIDVEGYEMPALQGAEKVLKNHTLKMIIIELNDSGSRYKIEDREIVGFLENLGFKAYDYNPFKRHFAALDSYNKTQFNTVFIRDLPFVQKRVNGAPKVKVLNREI